MAARQCKTGPVNVHFCVHVKKRFIESGQFPPIGLAAVMTGLLSGIPQRADRLCCCGTGASEQRGLRRQYDCGDFHRVELADSPVNGSWRATPHGGRD
jgi:hypothetical protein